MKPDPSSTDLLRLVKPESVRRYASKRGWTRAHGIKSGVAVFNRSAGGLDQLFVPEDDSFDDYSRRLWDVVSTIAEVESRLPTEVINDLLAPDTDVLKYRVVSSATTQGWIPLSEGTRLLEGARRSLLAAAGSVTGPASLYPRLNKNRAQQLLSSCRLGQTERGSFAFTVLCPLNAVGDHRPRLPEFEEAPFARMAVETLVRSVSRIVSIIESNELDAAEQGDVNPLLVDNSSAFGRTSTISANLCDALLQMQPEEKEAEVSISASWAPTLPGPKGIPAITVLRSRHFAGIERIIALIRPGPEPEVSRFFGYVEHIGRHHDEEVTEASGEVTFRVLYDKQLQLVRAELSGDEWRVAHKAVGEDLPVSFRGVLVRGGRIHRVSDLSELEVLPRS